MQDMRYTGYFPPTPLRVAETWSGSGHSTYLKLECELPTGSFKVRGAVYALTRRRKTSNVREVVAASTGNHGAAVAYAARLAAIPATIFVPRGANAVKLARIVNLGAALRETGDLLAHAIDAAESYAHDRGAYFLHDATDPDVPIGAGSIATEILD